jgi:hypothetical protein
MGDARLPGSMAEKMLRIGRSNKATALGRATFNRN